MQNSKVYSELVSHFFGEKNQSYQKGLDGLVKCTSLDMFKTIRESLSEQFIEDLFENCNRKDNMSGRFNDRECRNVYTRLRIVHQNADFI